MLFRMIVKERDFKLNEKKRPNCLIKKVKGFFTLWRGKFRGYFRWININTFKIRINNGKQQLASRRDI